MAERVRPGQLKALGAAALSVCAGAGTASLVALGRPRLPLPSIEWASIAGVAAAALVALFCLQTVLIALAARRRLSDAVRVATRSFAPLLLLWPLLLGVTFWDEANHWFVYHPGLGLWWGGVGFLFVVVQVSLLPVQLDGVVCWRPIVARWHTGLLSVFRHDPQPLVVVVFVYTFLRLTMRFAFETARFVDPKPGFDLFYTLATLTDKGVYPYLHRWSEYPPGFPWLSAGVYRAVSFFGVTYERYYAAITLALLPFGIGSLVLVYKLTERAWNRRQAVRAAWGFTALAVPIYWWMRSFDSLGVFFLLLAVWLVVERRRATAMLAVTAGMLVKVMPVVAAIVVLRSSPTWRSRVGLVALAAAYLAAALLPFWIAGRTWVEASVGNMLHRPPWGTAWALLEGHFDAGWANPYRLNPATATSYDFVGRMPVWFWGLPLLALAATFLYLAWRPRPIESPRVQIRVAFLSLLVFLLYLKGWSPSFVNWIFPFLLILYPNGRGVMLAVVIGALELFWWPVAKELGMVTAGLALSVAWRTLLFVTLIFGLLRHIRSSPRRLPPVRPG